MIKLYAQTSSLADVSFNMKDGYFCPLSSIFLAGPTPRDKDVKSWRPEAVAILERLGFNGVVAIPEAENGVFKGDYDGQVEWEHEALEMASVIVFWVPRDLKTMPAMITNVEFGRYVSPYCTKSVVYGRPPEAPKNRYLDWHYRKWTGQEPCFTLEDTLKTAVNKILMPS